MDAIVSDPATARALKPYYRYFCKRPCFHDEYLEAFNRPNVTLVDTDGASVERVTKSGIIAQGREYELDCIIYSTGFEVGTSFSRRAGVEIYGREGVTLTEAWGEGVRTFHSMFTHGFPNLFTLNISQAPLVANQPSLLDIQSNHITGTIKLARERGLKVVEVEEGPEQEWVDMVTALTSSRSGFAEGCTPGYYNGEGQVDTSLLQSGPFPGGFGGLTMFIGQLNSWLAEGEFRGFKVK